MQPFRLDPQMSAGSYKTYQVLQPRATHWRKATCAEAECSAHRNGWRTTIDVCMEIGARQAQYIEKMCGRRFETERSGQMVTYTFEAGQECFADHQVPLERDPIYIVRDGDWRGNPRGTQPTVHRNGADWVEDFAEHQQALADRLEEG